MANPALTHTKKPLIPSRSSVSVSYLSLLLQQDHVLVHFLRLWSLPGPLKKTKTSYHHAMSQKDELNISAELVFFDKKTKIRLISEETLQTLNCCADL